MDLTFKNPVIRDYFESVEGAKPPLEELDRAMLSSGITFLRDLQSKAKHLKRTLPSKKIGPNLINALVQNYSILSDRIVAYNALMATNADDVSQEEHDTIRTLVLETLRKIYILINKIEAIR